jgi:hypothetical protein
MRERFVKGQGAERRRLKRDNIRKGIYILPNLFTSASLFAGFYAIVATLNGDFGRAAWAIIISMICDGADGRIARMTSSTSRFGVEYDSLADLVSFDQAAVTVIGVLAEADVGDHAQLGDGLLHRGHAALDDSIRRVGAGAARVLRRGNAEEDHARDAEVMDELHLVHQLIHAQTEDAGHGGHRLAHPAPFHHEERQYEIVA